MAFLGGLKLSQPSMCSTRPASTPQLPFQILPLQQRARTLSGLSAGPSPSCGAGAASARGRPTCLRAKRREIEPAYFGDLYDGMAEMVMEAPTTRLPHMELLIMIKSVETMQEAAKALTLIARQVAARTAAGEEDSDWHLRKKYLTALMEITWTKLKAPQLAFEVMANPERYKTATYYCCDVIESLAALGAPPEMLMRIFEINKTGRLPTDKGVKASLRDLAAALKAQGADAALKRVVESQVGREDGVRFSEEIRMYVKAIQPSAAPPAGSGLAPSAPEGRTPAAGVEAAGLEASRMAVSV